MKCFIQVREIEHSLAQLKAESHVISLKKELLELSTECRKAFAAAGLEYSDNPQIRRAFELCSTSSSHDVHTEAAVAIGILWKRDGHEQETSDDRKELATSILGEDLVGAMVEEKTQPPDVSCIGITLKHIGKFPALLT